MISQIASKFQTWASGGPSAPAKTPSAEARDAVPQESFSSKEVVPQPPSWTRESARPGPGLGMKALGAMGWAAASAIALGGVLGLGAQVARADNTATMIQPQLQNLEQRGQVNPQPSSPQPKPPISPPHPQPPASQPQGYKPQPPNPPAPKPAPPPASPRIENRVSNQQAQEQQQQQQQLLQNQNDIRNNNANSNRQHINNQPNNNNTNHVNPEQSQSSQNTNNINPQQGQSSHNTNQVSPEQHQRSENSNVNQNPSSASIHQETTVHAEPVPAMPSLNPAQGGSSTVQFTIPMQPGLAGVQLGANCGHGTEAFGAQIGVAGGLTVGGQYTGNNPQEVNQDCGAAMNTAVDGARAATVTGLYSQSSEAEGRAAAGALGNTLMQQWFPGTEIKVQNRQETQVIQQQTIQQRTQVEIQITPRPHDRGGSDQL